MAEATSALSYNYPEYQPQPSVTPRVRVVPGRATSQPVSTLPSAVIVFAKLGALLLVAAALVCFVRVALVSATVGNLVQSQELSSQIDAARADGNRLEVQQSLSANPATVKDKARSLGMGAPDSVGTINLDADVVASDNSGNLSLSKSLQLLACG